MARSSTVSSSLPSQDQPPDDEIDLMAPPEDGEEEMDELEENPEDERDQADAVELSFASVEAMETQARAEGWRPLAEFTGRAGTWKSAGQFIRDGRNFLPFVKKQLRESQDHNSRLEGEMQGMRTELTQTRQDMQKLLDFSRRASQQSYDKAIKDLEERQRQAVQEGDVSTFETTKDQIDQMQEAREEAGVDEPPQQQRPQPQPRVQPNPVVEKWLGENGWYNTDPVLNAAMIAEHTLVLNTMTGLTARAQLDRAKDAVVARFPEKFGLEPAPANDPPRTPRRPTPPLSPRQRVPEPPRQGAVLTFENSIADPAERAAAQAAYRRLKGTMSDFTVAEYLEIYVNPHAEVDYTQRKTK